MTTPVPSPVTGDAYVLTSPEGHGVGLGHIPTGSEVTVVDVHPAGTAGVGHAGDTSVVLSHYHETHVLADDGTPVPGRAPRHFSLHIADFLRLFTKVDA
jgi:hypothetical protein